ncbi:MAG: hypothetical protein JW855_05565 [Gammaproteobacteria bacterium]|nr:hypothetical protein [Gammaproteobacteria bacterium]
MLRKLKILGEKLILPLILVGVLSGGVLAPQTAEAKSFFSIIGDMFSTIGNIGTDLVQVMGDVIELAKSLPGYALYMMEIIPNIVKVFVDAIDLITSIINMITAANGFIQAHDPFMKEVNAIATNWIGAGFYALTGREDEAKNELEAYQDLWSNIKKTSEEVGSGKNWSDYWTKNPISSGSLNGTGNDTYQPEQQIAALSYSKYVSGGGTGITQPSSSWKPTYEVIKYYGAYGQYAATASSVLGFHMKKYSSLADIEGTGMSVLNNLEKMVIDLASASAGAAGTLVATLLQKVFMLVTQVFTLPFTIMHALDQFDHIAQGVGVLNSSVNVARFQSMGQQMLQNAQMSQPGAAQNKKNGHE